ncbi:MAG TPA: copper ion binding protein, partial [Labilithrix sp.]|nr:copper ion binding protein [Labilithrix sp.]
MVTTAIRKTAAKLDLPIEGMTCASCVRRVERALSATDGVVHAEVNYALGRATVTYDPERTSREAIALAIQGAGYEVPSTEKTVELGVIGMTCAACVRRVERALRSLEGVRDVNVNLVTHRANITFDAATVSTDTLAAALEKAGYEPVREDASEQAGDARNARLEEAEDREHLSLRRDLIIAAALTGPLLVVAMSHGTLAWTQTRFGQWLQFALATVVV